MAGRFRTLNGETQMELVELIKKYPDRHANIQSSRAMGNRGKGRQGVAGTKEAKENGEEGRRSLLKANLVRISLVKPSRAVRLHARIRAGRDADTKHARLHRPGMALLYTARLGQYLWSSNRRNTSLYERHGFEIVDTIQVGSSPSSFPIMFTADAAEGWPNG
jgi:hypothetical protein